MCGIVAMFSREETISKASLEVATRRLRHRGPDQQRCWVADHGQVALGHARLSIIDLATGDQPIANEDGSLRIVVNGEFYDYERIRLDLERRGHKFGASSDSEIALHLYEEFGVDCLTHLRGEFAFALWDESRRRLFAARDRFGVKPLFYATVGGTLYLASEAKALFAAGVPARWDRESFFQQLFVCLHQDRTLFEGVYQVPPGHYLIATRESFKIIRYWDLNYPISAEAKPELSEADYVEQVRDKLDEAVRLRLRADVPVGCFLSGGLDSSTVLALASKHSPEPVKAYTITFNQPGYDEGAIARETSAHVGASFFPIAVDQAVFADHIADAIWHAEMLGVNLHGVARYLNSRAVHDAGYKVVLSGEGADEVFAGYSYSKQDMVLADGAAAPPASLKRTHQALGFTPAWLKRMAIGRSFFNLLLARDFAQEFADRDPYGDFLEHLNVREQVEGREPLLQSLYLWSKSILPNYILFAERLEMAHAVEVRLPFLDHHLFEFARAIPVSLLIREMKEKYVLREAARPLLTDTVYRRAKHPFTAPPTSSTEDGSLNRLMQDCLRSSDMSSVPFFDQGALIALLDSLPHMDEGRRLTLDPVLLMILCAYFLQRHYHL